MNLLIAGDLVANESNETLFTNMNLNKILGEELYNIWDKADYKIFNLEAPITKSTNAIDKCGPNLKNNPDIINGLKKMNPSCIMLSNNHIFDFSEEGLIDTINVLDKNQINWIGVGINKTNLKKSIIINDDIGIYNCCETEFSNVTETTAGANYYNEFEIEKDIKDLKKKCKYLIVVYHGGKEYYRYPSPILQKRCRQMIEYGANLITCQHSHCIGCKEEYKEGLIIYGQGNFIFNQNSNEYWDTSILINLDLNDYSIDFIPIMRTEFGTKLANNENAHNILEEFEKRSDEIIQDGFIKEKYSEFAKQYICDYLLALHGNNIIYRILNRLCGRKLAKIFYNKKNLLPILNFIECESHRELMIQGLKNKIYRDKDNKNE